MTERFPPKLNAAKARLSKMHTKEAGELSQLDTGSTRAQEDENIHKNSLKLQTRNAR